MSNRDSKDAWAGIVDLGSDDKVAKSSQAPPVAPQVSDRHLDVAVDRIPTDAKPVHERNVTQEDPDPPSLNAIDVREGSPSARKPLRLRNTPIIERPSKGVTQDTALPPSPIDLPMPEDADGDDPISPAVTFSPYDSLGSLETPPNRCWNPKPKASWRDYREVVLVIAVGGLIILAFTLFSGHDNQKAQEQKPTEKSVATQRLERIRQSRAGQLPKQKVKHQTPPTSPPPKSTEPTLQRIVEEHQQPPNPRETIKANVPMLSILSTPVGALVEIEGKVYGTTPLIRMSPKTKGPIRIKLRLRHHKNINSLVRPNENGHYEAQFTFRRK